MVIVLYFGGYSLEGESGGFSVFLCGNTKFFQTFVFSCHGIKQGLDKLVQIFSLACCDVAQCSQFRCGRLYSAVDQLDVGFRPFGYAGRRVGSQRLERAHHIGCFFSGTGGILQHGFISCKFLSRVVCVCSYAFQVGKKLHSDKSFCSSLSHAHSSLETGYFFFCVFPRTSKFIHPVVNLLQFFFQLCILFRVGRFSRVVKLRTQILGFCTELCHGETGHIELLFKFCYKLLVFLDGFIGRLNFGFQVTVILRVFFPLCFERAHHVTPFLVGTVQFFCFFRKFMYFLLCLTGFHRHDKLYFVF